MSKPFKKHFVALAAPSGGGKTTLCQMLLKRYADTRLSISHTTRAPRTNEKDGVDYYFVSQEEFKTLIAKQELAEWALVHGNYYGTGKKFLEGQRDINKVVLLDIDVQGVDSLKSVYPSDTLSIFIHPPSMAELEVRLRARKTESDEKIQERLKNARAEIERAKDFDFELTNIDLHETFAQLCTLVEQEIGIR